MLKLEKRLTRPHQKEKTFTLADVRDAVKNSTTLKGTRIRDLTSAVSSFCGLIGRDANAVPLDLGAIRQELGAINPAAAGISAKRLANIRSDLLAAITASGLKALKRPPKKLTEPWSDLRKKLKTRGHQFGLSRFCHYASAEGIAPTDVDDAHVAAFMVWVHENAFHRNPNELHRQTAMIWNTVAAEHTELGLKFVTLPSFRDMADGTKNAFNKQLVKALVQIAREWVKVDGVTLTELKRLAGKVPEPRGDLTQKNKRFLRQFDDPATLQRLRALPEKLWSRVRRDGAPSYRTLAVAQAALAQEILTYMPLRIQNLAALTFDEHLFLSYGREAVSSLEISAEEVKNEQFIAFDLPPHIARMLMEYRDEIAPNIIGRKPDRLFVNSDGTAKLPQTLSKLIQRVIGKETGIEISAHQFRHLAAKIILDHSPGAFELVKQLLGHQSLKTTVNSYSGIDTRRAARHHHQLLEKWSEEHAHDLRPSGAKRRFKSKTSKKKH
jgi:hypothetical protein